MSYTVTYDMHGKASVWLDGKLQISSDPTHPDRVEFEAWNAKQRPPLDTSDRVIEPPAPVKPREDLLAIVAKAPEALLAELWADYAQRRPDEAQAALGRLGMADTVREERR